MGFFWRGSRVRGQERGLDKALALDRNFTVEEAGGQKSLPGSPSYWEPGQDSEGVVGVDVSAGSQQL